MAASISLDTARSDPRLGGTVYFNIAGVPKNVQNPRVEVVAYQDTCDPSKLTGFSPDPCAGDPPYETYREGGSVAQAVGDGTDPLGYSGFLLGGGMSVWLQQGGPAHCVANLFQFDKQKGQQVYVKLAKCEFDAAG